MYAQRSTINSTHQVIFLDRVFSLPPIFETRRRYSHPRSHTWKAFPAPAPLQVRIVCCAFFREQNVSSLLVNSRLIAPGVINIYIYIYFIFIFFTRYNLFLLSNFERENGWKISVITGLCNIDIHNKPPTSSVQKKEGGKTGTTEDKTLQKHDHTCTAASCTLSLQDRQEHRTCRFSNVYARTYEQVARVWAPQKATGEWVRSHVSHGKASTGYSSCEKRRALEQ